MWKHKNFINLQLCAGPIPYEVIVNGTTFYIQRLSDSGLTGENIWSYNASINTDNYTISGNTVVWNDGTILQYNGVDVASTDNIVFNGQYTTRSATPTLTFKHFYDAGTIGSGTVKFRHYSQTEPLPQLATPQNVTADGTTVSWDEVENATSYAVLADGVSIGEYVPGPSGYDLLIGGHDMYSGDTDTIAYIKFNGVATSTDYDWKAYTKYLTSYVKDKNGNDVSFPLELNNITNVNIYLQQGVIDLFSQSFNTIGNHNIVLSTNENTNISMVAYD